MILDLDVCMYDAYIYVPWSLTLMHVSMMHIFLIPIRVAMMYIYVWCIYPWSLILMHACMMHILLTFDPWPWCMYVWCMHLLSLIMTYLCTLDWMYVWWGKFFMHGETLTLMHIYMMHVCTMHIHICSLIIMHVHDAYVHDALMYDASVILNPWLYRMCVWCGWNFVPDGRTNEQGDSRSLIPVYQYTNIQIHK